MPATGIRRRFAIRREAASGDRGSASLWVVAGGVLVLLVAMVAVLRGSAVLAREQAEVAADLAALAVADGIGVDGSSTAMCARGTRIAAANQAHLVGCAVRLGADGRTGTVDVTVVVRTRLAAVGSVAAYARARAGRLAWGVTGSAARVRLGVGSGIAPRGSIARGPTARGSTARGSAERGSVAMVLVAPVLVAPGSTACGSVPLSWAARHTSARDPVACDPVARDPVARDPEACDDNARGQPRAPPAACRAPACPVHDLWHDWIAAGLEPVCAQPKAWRDRAISEVNHQ